MKKFLAVALFLVSCGGEDADSMTFDAGADTTAAIGDVLVGSTGGDLGTGGTIGAGGGVGMTGGSAGLGGGGAPGTGGLVGSGGTAGTGGMSMSGQGGTSQPMDRLCYGSGSEYLKGTACPMEKPWPVLGRVRKRGDAICYTSCSFDNMPQTACLAKAARPQPDGRLVDRYCVDSCEACEWAECKWDATHTICG